MTQYNDAAKSGVVQTVDKCPISLLLRKIPVQYIFLRKSHSLRSWSDIFPILLSRMSFSCDPGLLGRAVNACIYDQTNFASASNLNILNSRQIVDFADNLDAAFSGVVSTAFII